MLDFWEYVYEREAVRHRRFDLEEDPPWTDDPVLATVHFTNIFREDNKRSRIAEQIIDGCSKDRDRLWNLMLFRRLCQTTSTWTECVDFPATADDLDDIEDAIRSSGKSPWSTARQTYPMKEFQGEDAVARTVECLFRDWEIAGEVAAAMRADDTMRGAFKVLRWHEDIAGMGDFLSWQLTLDSRYGEDPIVNEWSGDWAPQFGSVRTGATFYRMWPYIRDVEASESNREGAPRVTGSETLEMMREVVEQQHDRFRWRGLDLHDVSNERSLAVPDVEHVLCGIQRYWRISAGFSKPRRTLDFF